MVTEVDIRQGVCNNSPAECTGPENGWRSSGGLTPGRDGQDEISSSRVGGRGVRAEGRPRGRPERTSVQILVAVASTPESSFGGPKRRKVPRERKSVAGEAVLSVRRNGDNRLVRVHAKGKAVNIPASAQRRSLRNAATRPRPTMTSRSCVGQECSALAKFAPRKHSESRHAEMSLDGTHRATVHAVAPDSSRDT